MDQLSKDLIQLSSEYLTKSEVLSSYKKIIAQILKVETALIKKLEDEINNLKSDFNRFENNMVGKYETLERGKQGEKGIDGINGKDADEEKIIAEVLNKISLPENGKDADETKIVAEVLNKIKLPEVEIEDVKGLKEELERLEAIKRLGGRGGGTSAMGVANAAKYFVKTEAPVGAIDSLNKSYSVSKPIFAILSFVINGEHVARLPNFSISGNTITFTEAIPSAYNGKDIEIVYI